MSQPSYSVPSKSRRGLLQLGALLFLLLGHVGHAQVVPGALDPGYRFRSTTALVPKAMSLEPDGRMVVMPGGVGGGSGVHILSSTTGARETQLFSPSLSTTGDRHVLLRQAGGRLIARVASVQSGGKTLNGFGAFHLNGSVDGSFYFPSMPAGATRSFAGAADIGLGAAERVHVVGTGLPFGGANNAVWITLDRDGNEVAGRVGASGEQVLRVLEQADGKVLLGGTFTTPNGTRTLVRRGLDGELDSGFDAVLPGSASVIRQMADGRLLVSGVNPTRQRPFVWVLNTNGSRSIEYDLDSMVEGISANSASVVDVLAQDDGKILLGGSFTAGGVNLAVARLLPSGELDWEFNSELTATSPVTTMLMKDNLLYLGVNRSVVRMLLGEPVVGGAPVVTVPPASGRHPAGSQVFLQVTATGTPPLTYQWRRNGTPIPLETSDRYLFQLTQLNAGDFDVVVGNSFGSVTSAVAAVRLDVPAPVVTLVSNTVQTLGFVSSFGPWVTGEVPPTFYQWYKDGQAVPGQTNLSYSFNPVAAGDAGTYRFVLQDTFGNSVTSNPCVVTIEMPPPPRVMVQPVSVVALAGTTIALDAQFESLPQQLPPVVQWRHAGTNIAGGTVSLLNGLYFARLLLESVQPDAEGLYDCSATSLGGTSPFTREVRVTVKTATSPDTVDPTFDAGAAQSVAFNNPNGSGAVEGIAIQADDKVVVVGNFKQWNGQARTNIVRLNVNGTVDATFAGHVFTPTVNGEISVPGVAVAPDGKIYVAGQWGTVDGRTDPMIRLNADGTLDTTFSVGDAAPGHLMLTLPDGTLLNNGGALVANRLRTPLRYPQGGALDTAFGGPFTAARFSGLNASAWFAEPDGSIVMGGAFGANDAGGFGQFNLAKVNADGTLAAGFHSPLTQPEFVNRLARLPDGKFVAAGDFQSPTRNLRRFHADGSVDIAFDSPLTDASTAALLAESDGTVLTTAGNGTRLHRLLPNGVSDDAYLVQVNLGIRHLAVDSKGRVVIAGFFSQVTGAFDDAAHRVDRRSIARLYGRNRPGTIPPVRLGAVTFTPGGPLGFTLPTVPGVTYILETKATLGDTAWTVSQTITGDGSTRTLQAAIAGVQGYYRVRIVQ
jgi:uncharacterized delta-60 repeat protein